jgi:hypothetical protein
VLPITNVTEWNTALTQLNGRTGEYTLTISGDILIGAYIENNSFGTTPDGSTLSVTLQGNGKLARSYSYDGNVIRIGANQTLIIDSENLILQGSSNNTSAVYVENGGALELKNGTITGNTIRTRGKAYGGGVNVAGTFIMSGGEISGNTASITGTDDAYGGGVYIGQRATFAMSGGKISGNSANGWSNGYGGGVYVDSSATFTMSGGEISGNTAGGSLTKNGGNFGYGGGVYVGQNAAFTMIDGTISSNTAGVKNINDCRGYGGGICLSGNGIFRIVNGTVYGTYNEPNTALRNTVVGGPPNSGGAALGAALYITSSTGTAEHGTFNDTTWNSTGSLASNFNATINVVNGELQLPPVP